MLVVLTGDVARSDVFEALDEIDGASRLTALTSFSAWYYRTGGTRTAFGTLTIAETATGSGIYTILINVGTTLSAGVDYDILTVEIEHTGMRPVLLKILITRREVSPGYTLGINSGGALTQAVPSVTGLVGGIAGVIQTLDALDTAQDTQHAVTRTTLKAAVKRTTAYPASRTITTGLETGTIANLQADDTNYHVLRPNTSDLDVQYSVMLGSNAAEVDSVFRARLVNEAGGGQPSSISIYAWDWVGTTYSVVGTISSSSMTSINLTDIEDYVHPDTGEVILRVADTGGTNYRIDVDRISILYDRSIAQLTIDIDTKIGTPIDNLSARLEALNVLSVALAADLATLQEQQDNGPTLTVLSGSTTSSLIVTAPAGITSSHLTNAVIICKTTGRTKATTTINSVTGSTPTFTLGLSPVLPDDPEVGDEFLLGPKYRNTAGLVEV